MSIRESGTPAGAHPKGNQFGWVKLEYKAPANTVTSGPAQMHPYKPAFLSKHGHTRLQSFPDDYNFIKCDPRYVCGMSVPPYMMNRVSDQIYKQWLGGLNG